MKIKKLLALLLCLALLLTTVLGCNQPNDEIPDDENGNHDNVDITLPDDNEQDHFHGFVDFEAAITSFPPDTIMFSAGEYSITWADFYVFLFNATSSLLYTYGGPLEWSEFFEPDKTLAETVLEYATQEALSFVAFMYGAYSNNFQMSDDDLKTFNEEMEKLFEMYGGREVLELTLRENGGFYNLEVFENLYKVEFNIGLLMNSLYGEDAASLSDEEVASFAKENEFLMAMHILRLKSDEEGADPLGEAEEILKQLQDQKGSDDFIEFFHDLMHEKSEDYGGLMSYPNGYLFVHKDMVEEFSDTTASLEIGELSGIVETMYGYHIILRIPIDYDTVPSELSREGINRTLRQEVALINFDALHTQWMESLNVVFSPEYNSLDLAEIFKWQDEDCDH